MIYNDLCTYWELSSWPDLRDIKGVKAKLVRIRILGLHDLDLGRPLEFLTALNALPELPLAVIRILTRDANGFRLGELLLSMLRDEVVFDVHKLALLVDPLESVASISVVFCPALRGSMVGEEHQAGVITLWSAAQKIKCSVIVEEEVFWVACLGPDHVGTLNGVTAEEDWEVQADNVVVAFLGVEFDGESTRVSGLIRKFAAKGDGTEADEDRSLLSDGLEEVGFLCTR